MDSHGRSFHGAFTIRGLTLALLLFVSAAAADESKTVIGYANQPLKEGADALNMGDAEEGVRLTELGLKRANTTRERQTGYSNLCAGFVMLERFDEALENCSLALAENENHWRARSNRALVYIKLKDYERADADLQIAESLRPNARSVQGVRRMLQDVVNPVAPNVLIDDRRQAPDGNDVD